MNINELDNFNLQDAVKFHDRLNPSIWGKDENLKPEVREKLLEIAADFQEFLGVPDLDVIDITVSGSNAAFSYTSHSDIDLHLVIKMPEQNRDVYQELFNAKKYQYNDEHSITVGGADVELYAQPSDQSAVSQGIYSVRDSKWIQVPKRRKADINDSCVKAKTEDLDARIHSAIKAGDREHMEALWHKIKTMRQAGLDKSGEFGCENLAFKILRTSGCLNELKLAVNAAKDRELSVAEQVKKPVVYGFRSNMSEEDAGHQGSSSGVSPDTRNFLSEEPDDVEGTVREFIDYAAEYLDIETMPEIHLHNESEWSKENHSFGMYVPEEHTLYVNLANRHIMDILRTTAHELAHCRQHELDPMPGHAGNTGSPWENEANAVAGIIMRHFADAHPGLFENASGYIPRNKKEARDPRYSMALTVDIKPGQVGKEANKLALDTGKNGEPTLLMKSANLQESLAAEFAAFAEGKSYGYNSTPLSQVPGETEDELGNQEATGPEFPPQMPAGTTKIDVTDLTDWYRLGMDISDMDDADPEDYNQGPPQTVVVFPSDEAEQGYLKQFKRLGLKTHDIDTDVEGGEDLTGKHLHKELAEEFELLEREFLGEINMGAKSLRKEAAATGALAGMEFEMIVPNVSNDDDSDQEPDWDMDESVNDIDDACNFFDDGDFNSSRQIRNLRESMLDEYQTWVYEQTDNAWHNRSEGFEFFKEYMDREDAYDRDAGLDAAAEYVREENPDMEVESEEFQQAVSERMDQQEADYYTEQWDEQGKEYDYAREKFDEEKQDDYNQGDWLESEGIGSMQDVGNRYDISWPHYTSSNNGEGDIDQVADDFSKMIGKPINSSQTYHGARREPGHYVVEPDGSLQADSRDDTGLEFVSPPMPIDEMISDLNKVKAWASTYGCYTNDSTGLHINISVPNYSLEKLDFVKLALLLGDEYVLDNFGRAGNTYAKSALKLVKEKVQSDPATAKQLLDKMKSNLDGLATKAIHSGTTSKFTSINTKDGYIEFRSPGGDWLDENFDKIENTLMRFTVAMNAAINPEAYRQEYQKKLYKLLTENNKDTDTIKYFAQYAAGELPKAALRSFVKQAQLERKLAKGKDLGKMWWNVKYNGQRIEVVADNVNGAKQIAAKEWGIPALGTTLDQMTAEPLRPYEEKSTGPTLNGRPSNPDGNWVIIDNREPTKPVYRFMASDNSDAFLVLRQWIEANRGSGAEWNFAPDSNQRLGQPGDTQSAEEQPAEQDYIGIRSSVNRDQFQRDSQGNVVRFPSIQAANNYMSTNNLDRSEWRVSDLNMVDAELIQPQQPAQQPAQQGNWGIWMSHADRFARMPGTGDAGPASLRRFPSREAGDAFLTQTREENPRMRTDVEVREIEPSEPVPGSTLDLQRQRAAQQGVDTSVPYELYNRNTGEVIDTFPARNDDEARVRLDDYRNLGAGQFNPEAFGVRRGPGMTNTASSQRSNATPQTPDQAQDGIIDVEPDVAQNFAPQTLTRPGQGQQVFTGDWKVMIDGEQVYQFRGIGNNQGDANRVGRDWVRQQVRQGTLNPANGADIEVLPVMGEAE